MSKDEFALRLELTSKQADVLVSALDLYSRILIGQFEEIAHLSLVHNVDMLPEKMMERHHQFSDELRKLKERLLAIPRNGSFGIHSKKVSDLARVAYDIQQVVRNALAWERTPGGGIGVNFDRPMQTSSQKLPPAKILKKDSGEAV